MGRTRDRYPGVREEEETRYDTNATPDGGAGSVSFDGTDFVFEDGAGTFNPREGSVGHLVTFTALDAIFPTASPAGSSSRNQHSVLTFDDGGTVASENVIFEGVMPADYSAGSLTVDIYWLADTATSGDAKWNFQFEAMAGLDLDADSFATAQTATGTANGTNGILTVTSITFTQAQAASIAAQEAFRGKLTRDTPDAGDTMAGDAQVPRVVIRQ